MGISYKRLFHILIDRDMKPSELKQIAILSNSTMTKLHKNLVIQTDTIGRICKALNVQPGDIMEYIDE